MPETGEQTSSAHSGSGGPDRRGIGRTDLRIVPERTQITVASPFFTAVSIRWLRSSAGNRTNHADVPPSAILDRHFLVQAVDELGQFLDEAAADGDASGQEWVLMVLVDSLPDQKVDEVGPQDLLGEQPGAVAFGGKLVDLASRSRLGSWVARTSLKLLPLAGLRARDYPDVQVLRTACAVELTWEPRPSAHPQPGF